MEQDLFVPDPQLAGFFMRRGRPQSAAEMAGITGIAWNGAGAGGVKLRDLTGIERLGGMQMLCIRNGAVRDLAPLRGLARLESLCLRGNRVEDLSPLAALPSLRELDLAHNRISDLSPLYGLTKLEVLELDGNPADPAAFAALHRVLDERARRRAVPDTGREIAAWHRAGLVRMGGMALEELRILRDAAQKRAWLTAHGDTGRLERQLRACIDTYQHKARDGLAGWEVRVLAVLPFSGGERELEAVTRIVRETHMNRLHTAFTRSDTVYAVTLDENGFEPL